MSRVASRGLIFATHLSICSVRKCGHARRHPDPIETMVKTVQPRAHASSGTCFWLSSEHTVQTSIETRWTRNLSQLCRCAPSATRKMRSKAVATEVVSHTGRIASLNKSMDTASYSVRHAWRPCSGLLWNATQLSDPFQIVVLCDALLRAA